jgi:hypothetical protein
MLDNASFAPRAAACCLRTARVVLDLAVLMSLPGFPSGGCAVLKRLLGIFVVETSRSVGLLQAGP